MPCRYHTNSPADPHAESDKSRTKKDAAEAIQLTPDTIYRWPDYVDDALLLAQENLHDAIIEMRKQSALKAMSVKVALLDSEDENVRSRAATELIEWELGKAMQRGELTVERKNELADMSEDELDNIIGGN